MNFQMKNVVLVDQKTPRELGLTDVPIMSDIWDWTDPDNNDEYPLAGISRQYAQYPPSSAGAKTPVNSLCIGSSFSPYSILRQSGSDRNRELVAGVGYHPDG